MKLVVVVVAAISTGCRTTASPAVESPSERDREAMLVLDDVIVTAANGNGTVRSAIHGGIELEWSAKQRRGSGMAIEDRGELVVHNGSETCSADVDADNVVAVCGDLVVVYQRGVVTLVGRDPVRVIGSGTVMTTGDDDCGTRRIDESTMIKTIIVEMHGWRTIRCTDGSHQGPMIF